ncbi:hypothetical protein B1810_19700 [Panacagrimonas perspica]|nr:hypothetical protein B1810_19700 [Panacagrimonas perspica]
MGLACALLGGATAANAAGELGKLGDIPVEWQFTGLYSAAVRTEKPSDAILDAPPDPRIPIADFLQYPGGINSDDSDRNFKRGALINNRLSVLGELLFRGEDYGALFRGDAFYDDVYRSRNDNRRLDTVNKRSNDADEFSSDAARLSGRRARLLDAFVYTDFDIGEDIQASLRVGQQVVAWGESLFFGGLALAQGPADGTRANIPGADVKSILLPVNQISLKAAIGDDWLLLGLYKLDFKPTEANPVGEYFAVTDAVGAGAEFAYGIRNPLYLDSLAEADLLSNDLGQALQTIGILLGTPGLPLITTPELLPALSLPVTGIAPLNAQPSINVKYLGEDHPDSDGQYGIGLKYQLTENTDVGIYHLRYHDPLPGPVFTYGYAELAPPNGAIPAITTEVIDLVVPVTYQVKHFDGIHLTAAGFSTTLFGANIGGEFIWRENAIVLADVQTAFGPIPTPTRARTAQADLNALYIVGPAMFWDSITLIGNVGYQHVHDNDPVFAPDGTRSDALTYTRDSAAYSFLSFIDRRNVIDGWDLQVPVSFAGMAYGHSSLLAGFGSLLGKRDRRASVGLNMTRLQQLTIGLSYNLFLGSADYNERPLADRDYAALTVRYSF